MKKKLFILSLISFFFVCIFSFTTFNVNAQSKTQQEMVNEELQNIYLPDKAIIDFPLPVVSAYGSTIEWEAQANQTYITISEGWAKVTRPTNENKTVTLTVTITNGNASGERSFEITVLKGTTLTNTYDIIYELNGGTNNPANPTTYKVGTDVELLAPTKGSLEFLGWYLDPEFKGEAISALPKASSGDVKVYAKWEKAEIASIEVVEKPTKVEYNALEQFNPEGIKVVAVYNDGVTKEEIALEELTFDKTTLHGDDKEVTVTYEDFEATFEITVNKLKFDVSNVVFEDLEVTYDGTEHTITKPTNLPVGLDAKVEGSATNATTSPVLVKLVFTVSEEYAVDYEAPAAKEADLTINKANALVKVNPVYINTGVEFKDSMVTYTVEGLIGEDKLEGTFKPVYGQIDTSAPGTYEIGGEGLTSNNYNITYQKAQLVVSAGEYTVHAKEGTLTTVYNGQKQMFEVVIKDGDRVITGEELEKLTISYSYNNEAKDLKIMKHLMVQLMQALTK